MRSCIVGAILLLLTASCGNKANREASLPLSPSGAGSQADSATAYVAVEIESWEADDSFDDFIYNFAIDQELQCKRIKFPIPCLTSKETKQIEESHWLREETFPSGNYYTLLFDKETNDAFYVLFYGYETTEENGKPNRHFNAQIGTEHTINGRAYTLDMFRHESEGTKKIFALSSFLIDVLKTGKTLLIDELDARLHPLLLKHMIELFHDENLNGAQLIATSHSPSMLTENNFRRDQIWFMDKKADGGSHLVSLADFTHIRGNYHRIVQDYLRGCFGGVPYIQDLKVN